MLHALTPAAGRPWGAAYNFQVQSKPMSLVFESVLARALLFANHVLNAEPAARQRLLPHVGRLLLVQWQVAPGPWPQPPELALRITPAGLFEQLDAAPPVPDLRVTVELPTPVDFALRWLAGERPRVAVDGDARLAADVAWLAENLRWDAEHDLARLVGDAWAHELLRIGGGVRDALRGLAQGLTRGAGGGATAAP